MAAFDYEARAPQHIVLRGVQTHNLKDVDCDVPHDALTVVTGVSGSGKSSLAFDTIYAEGQRRYTESLSTYARQFLQQMARPPLDEVHAILPAVALRQKNEVTHARSTVGTITEIDDHLQLLFTHGGVTRCPDDDSLVARVRGYGGGVLRLPATRDRGQSRIGVRAVLVDLDVLSGRRDADRRVPRRRRRHQAADRGRPGEPRRTRDPVFGRARR